MTDYSIRGGYNIDNEIDRIQKNMALQAVNQEEITKLYACFLENMHQNFLENYTTTAETDQLNLLLESWKAYLSEVQKDWDIERVKLLSLIEQHDKEQQFADGFSQFASKWEKELTTAVNKENSVSFSSDKPTMVYSAVTQQQSFFKETKRPIKTQKEYDVSDDGQARIYSTLFAQERAVLRGERCWFADFHAWQEGRGSLFPDFMATLRGERPIFATLRAFIADLIAELKAWMVQKPKLEQKEEIKSPETEADIPECEVVAVHH
jgi:hypothetical protein